MGDINSRLAGANALIRRTLLNVLARVIAGASHELHGYGERVAIDLLPDRATGARLQRWADMYGVTRLPATKAQGKINITSEADTTLPAGTGWQIAGQEYSVDTETSFTGIESKAVAITAVLAGTAGNAPAGSKATLLVPVTNIEPEATVEISPDEVEGGTNIETENAWRSRLLADMQQPEDGGSEADFIRWARQVSGVYLAWVIPYITLGTVEVRFIEAPPNYTATAGLPATVEAHINTKRPVKAKINADHCTVTTQNATISITPDTSALRTAVDDALDAFMLANLKPGKTIQLTKYNAAIANVDGVDDHTLTIPAADITSAADEIHVHGTVTWN